jgi:hypothetical protein
MHDHGRFFQYPLCLLARRESSFCEQLEEAFAHGVIAFIDKTRDEGKPEFRYMTKEKRQTAVEKCRDVIGFSGGSPNSFFDRNERALSQIATWTHRFGSTCTVRVRTDVHYSARDGDLSEREARVLFGLYSAIGNKPFVKATWQGIQRRAAGWVRGPITSTVDADCGPIYSRYQIDRALVELLERKLVAGATYNHGERFWSHSLTADELWAQISAHKLRARGAGSAHQQRNAERSRSLKAALEQGGTPASATP